MDVRVTEQLRDRKGRVVDDAYVDAAVDEAIGILRGRAAEKTGSSRAKPVRDYHDRGSGVA